MNLRKKISAFLDAIKNWEDPDFCLPEDEMGGFQYFFLHSETVVSNSKLTEHSRIKVFFKLKYLHISILQRNSKDNIAC